MRRILTTGSVVLATIIAAMPAMAQNHVALVLDNGRPLAVPGATPRAGELARALEKMNYRVVHGQRQSSAGIRDYIAQFRSGLDDAEVAVFYYTGPTLKSGDRNLLVGSNARPDLPIEQQTVPLDEISDLMNARQANLVFVDGGYANPIAQSLAGRSSGLSPAMASERVRRKFMVALANMPGKLMQSDAEGSFADVLLAQLGKQQVTVDDLTSSLRREVFDRSRGAQLPWIKSDLGRVQLASLPQASVPVIAPVLPKLTQSQRAAQVRLVQQELLRTKCVTSRPNGVIATTNQGLNRLRQSYKQGKVPVINVATAESPDFDAWLEWVRAIRQPICSVAIVRPPREIIEPPAPKKTRKARAEEFEPAPRRVRQREPVYRERSGGGGGGYRAPSGGGGGGGGFSPFAPNR